jgi:hypothetical protein
MGRVYRDLGSSDWIGLPEAAQMASKFLDAEITEEGVVKMGYLLYLHIPTPLRIYTFTRQPIEIRPVREELELSPMVSRTTRWVHDKGGVRDLETGKPLNDEELEMCIARLDIGDCFELNWPILEKIMLLRTWQSGDSKAVRMRVKYFMGRMSDMPADYKGRHNNWSDILNGVITPSIEIRWEDLRVDRQELREYLAQVKQAKEEQAIKDGGMGPIVQPIDREISGKSAGSNLRFIGALLKALNVGDIKQTTRTASKLLEIVEEASDSGPKQSWIENMLREVAREGMADAIKQGPAPKKPL